MKKLFLILAFVLGFSNIVKADNTAIEKLAALFPDNCERIIRDWTQYKRVHIFHKTLPEGFWQALEPLAPEVEDLDVSYCGLEEVPDLSAFVNLKKLNLSGLKAGLPEIGHLKHLEELSFSSCGLTEIHLPDLPNLKQLWLSENAFTKLPDFSMLTNLEMLYFDSNALTEVVLSNLPNLSWANFNKNQLTKIDFLNLPKLKILNLLHNHFEVMPDFSMLTSLKELNLLGNRFEGALTFSGLGELTELVLSENNLTAVNLSGVPKLNRLYLRDNRFKGVPDLSNLPNLSLLDVTGNQIDACPDLSGFLGLGHLIIERNYLTERPAVHERCAVKWEKQKSKAFDDLVLLFPEERRAKMMKVWYSEYAHEQRRLNVSGVPLPNGFWEALKPLAPLVKDLDVSQCELRSVPDLSAFTVLRSLDVHDNYLLDQPVVREDCRVTSYGQKQPPFQDFLDFCRAHKCGLRVSGKFYERRITVLGDHLPAGFWKALAPFADEIEMLNLNRCKLDEAPDLSKFTVLRELYMAHCQLTALPLVHSFVLDKVDLSGNTLTVAAFEGTDFFEKCPRIHVLNLSNTGLDAVPSAMCSLEQLWQLRLSKNNIAEIPDHFPYRFLRGLYLDGNQLRNMPAITRIRSFDVVDLSENYLVDIPEGSRITFNKQKQLPFTFLADLFPEHQAQMIADWEAHQRILVPEGPLPEGFDDLLKHYMKDVKVLDFRNCGVNTLPACIGNAEKLEMLVIAGNPELTSLPTSFQSLNNTIFYIDPCHAGIEALGDMTWKQIRFGLPPEALFEE